MSKELVFFVEDEANIQQLVKYNLELNGYAVEVFNDGESLLKQLKTTLPNLLILDLMLPGIDGIEICRQLKQNPKTKNLPVIMLTAKSEELDKVLGLELGADDYITKPFSVRELVARVKALLRRSRNSSGLPQDVIIKCGDITVDNAKRQVYKNDVLLDMPLKEFELLKILLQNRGKVLSREYLLEKVWGFDYYGETRTVDVHIRHLREKIEDASNPNRYIETIRGIGYRFTDRMETDEG